MITPFIERDVIRGRSFGLSAASYDVRIAESPILDPGEFFLASTMERFDIPNDVLMVVHDKSSWARRGLAVQNTIFDPGWRGYATLELTNHGEETLDILAGDPIAKVVCYLLTEPTTQPYAGKYQDQEAGPQHARDDGPRCGDDPPDAAEVDLHDVAAQLSAIEKIVRDLEYRLPGSGKPLANIALTRQQCTDLLAHLFDDAAGRFLRKLDGDRRQRGGAA
jgi:dCTP deaminase